MNTHTIINVKTDKKLKVEAKKVAAELGVPLSTVINAFLKQFVRDKEITLSANQYRPTPYLESILEYSPKARPSETPQHNYNQVRHWCHKECHT